LRRVILLTDRPPQEVLPALLSLEADVKAEMPTAEVLAALPDLGPDLVIVDGVSQPERAKELLQILVSAGSPVATMAVLPRSIKADEGWDELVDEFCFPEASEAELRVRLGMLWLRRGETGDAVIRIGPVAINVETYQVSIGGRALDLTFKEFELLRFLAEHPGRVFSRAKLLQEVWGYDFYGGTRTVDVHVRRLRSKLGPEHEQLIDTVRGVGYRGAELR
jgi:DNA-binding response OmpR family regulator